MDSPGSLHHVVNRGLGRRPIFESGRDVRYFLSSLAREARAVDSLSLRRRRPKRIEVLAYSCLTNHFHLLLQSLEGQLAESMRQVQGQYVRFFNRRHDRDGTLFRGRFKSSLVDSDEYFVNVVRYIDQNPVAAGITDRPEGHLWTSAGSYLTENRPRWLCTGPILKLAHRRIESAAGTSDSDSYRMAFGASMGRPERTWVERRLESGPAGASDLDQLVRAGSNRIGRWMRARAHIGKRRLNPTLSGGAGSAG